MCTVRVCVIHRQRAHMFTHGWFVCSCTQDGCTPLMEAVKNKNEEIALLLLRNGADPETTDKVRGWGYVSA